MNDDAKGDCNKQMTTVNADAASILLGGAIIAFGVGQPVVITRTCIGWLWRVFSFQVSLWRIAGRVLEFPGFFECILCVQHALHVA